MGSTCRVDVHTDGNLLLDVRVYSIFPFPNGHDKRLLPGIQRYCDIHHHVFLVCSRCSPFGRHRQTIRYLISELPPCTVINCAICSFICFAIVDLFQKKTKFIYRFRLRRDLILKEVHAQRHSLHPARRANE